MPVLQRRVRRTRRTLAAGRAALDGSLLVKSTSSNSVLLSSITSFQGRALCAEQHFWLTRWQARAPGRLDSARSRLGIGAQPRTVLPRGVAEPVRCACGNQRVVSVRALAGRLRLRDCADEHLPEQDNGTGAGCQKVAASASARHWRQTALGTYHNLLQSSRSAGSAAYMRCRQRT